MNDKTEFAWRKAEFEAVQKLDAVGSALLDRLGTCRARVHDRCSCARDIALLKELEALRGQLWPHNNRDTDHATTR